MNHWRDPAEFRQSSTPTQLFRAIAERNFVNLKRALHDAPIGPVGWRVLAALREKDGCNIAELARLTATDRSNLSRVIQGLETDGLVRRQAERADRRNILIFLNPAGAALFEEIQPIVAGIIDNCLDGFTAAEIDTLMGFLRRIKSNVTVE